MSSTELLFKFDQFYTELKKAFLELYPDKQLKQAVERLEKVIDYNVPFGKKLRGLCTYQSYLILSKTGKFDCEYEKKALALGWCIELLQASFLVADDIMDNSKTSIIKMYHLSVSHLLGIIHFKGRGQLCWHLNEGVGNIAINDSFYILSTVNMVIKKFLYDHPLYVNFYEIFSETFMQTTIGQNLDLMIGTPDKTRSNFDFTHYTTENYDTIVKWKTAYYSFYLPVANALYLANIDDKKIHIIVKEILLEMGHFFQVQDDYIDCYGDPKITGKIGTDIEEAKCSWLVTQALKKCSQDQKQLLEENYGKNDKDCVIKVKKLYDELNLKNDYEIYELKQHETLKTKIDSLDFPDFDCTSHIKDLLNVYLSKIFKRIN